METVEFKVTIPREIYVSVWILKDVYDVLWLRLMENHIPTVEDIKEIIMSVFVEFEKRMEKLKKEELGKLS